MPNWFLNAPQLPELVVSECRGHILWCPPLLAQLPSLTPAGGANVHKRENAQAEESTRGDFFCSELRFFWMESEVILHPFKSGIISTKGALRLTTTYDNHPSNPSIYIAVKTTSPLKI